MAIHAEPFVTLHDAALEPTPARTVARLEMPVEDTPGQFVRAKNLVQKIENLSVPQTERLVRDLRARFGKNHDDFDAILLQHARVIDAVANGHSIRDSFQELLIGASFTSEFAAAAVSVCNPTAMIHPNQDSVPAGSFRIAMAARAIGEGHVSSICFFEAMVNGDSWRFLPHHEHFSRATIDSVRSGAPPSPSETSENRRRIGLAAMVGGEKRNSRMRTSLISQEIDGYVRWRRSLLTGETSSAKSHAGDRLYRARFSPETTLSQRILLPEIPDEAHGLEDVRFVTFTSDDHPPEYRGCYGAFDGHTTSPRLLVSENLREFEARRLTGPATKDKGLALFPRKVNGEYLSLIRSDWRNIALARSHDGFYWNPWDVIYVPEQPWEIIKSGNCGSPIEIDDGWLVITHGVGPMRSYSFGALLLDKSDPSIVKGRLSSPFISAEGSVNAGYVPSAIYSCGGIVCGENLWLPFSEGDYRIRIASINVGQLLSQMSFSR